MRARRDVIGAALVALVGLSAASALAHTSYGRIVEAKPAVVEFKYTTGERMAYAEIAVIGPGTADPYQIGRADGAGRFAFIADKKGTWRVEARDEDKHTAWVTLDIVEAMAVRQPWQSFIEGAFVASLSLNLVAALKLWQVRDRVFR